MKFNKISIIGAGNLGLSIAEGLIKAGIVNYNNLLLSEPYEARRNFLKENKFQVTDDNCAAVKAADLIVLTVKPKMLNSVLQEIKAVLNPQEQVLLSCVTGANSAQIYSEIGKEMPLFRVMPNTGMSVRESMSCISAFNTTQEQNNLVEDIFTNLGEVIFISEEMMAAGTVMAGCGIAFALRFIRAAMVSGIEIGFTAEQSRIMAAQIAKGAADLVLNNKSLPEVEIDKVTTPGGITITGLNEMEHNGFSSSIIKGMYKAFEKVSK